MKGNGDPFFKRVNRAIRSSNGPLGSHFIIASVIFSLQSCGKQFFLPPNSSLGSHIAQAAQYQSSSRSSCHMKPGCQCCLRRNVSIEEMELFGSAVKDVVCVVASSAFDSITLANLALVTTSYTACAPFSSPQFLNRSKPPNNLSMTVAATAVPPPTIVLKPAVGRRRSFSSRDARIIRIC